MINFRVLTTFSHRKTSCTLAKYSILLGFSLGDRRVQFVELYMPTVILVVRLFLRITDVTEPPNGGTI